MSLKSRVKKLEQQIGFVNPSGPALPVIIAIWEQSLGLTPIDPQSAVCHDKTFNRRPSEPMNEFLDRIVMLEQRTGFCLIIWLDQGNGEEQ
jgi:hypothetical protein